MSAAPAERVGAPAAGALAAQHFVNDMQRHCALPAEAPDRIRAVAIEWGVDSPAVDGFLVGLAKRCR